MSASKTKRPDPLPPSSKGIPTRGLGDGAVEDVALVIGLSIGVVAVVWFIFALFV